MGGVGNICSYGVKRYKEILISLTSVGGVGCISSQGVKGLKNKS